MQNVTIDTVGSYTLLFLGLIGIYVLYYAMQLRTHGLGTRLPAQTYIIYRYSMYCI